jgi:hypothetical protein
LKRTGGIPPADVTVTFCDEDEIPATVAVTALIPPNVPVRVEVVCPLAFVTAGVVAETIPVGEKASVTVAFAIPSPF